MSKNILTETLPEKKETKTYRLSESTIEAIEKIHAELSEKGPDRKVSHSHIVEVLLLSAIEVYNSTKKK